MAKLKGLQICGLYSKSDLAQIINEHDLVTCREGIYYCNNKDYCLLFVDLEKQGKEERFRFNDFFDGENFNWDSQTTQSIYSPKIREIVSGKIIPHLFVRVKPKGKSKTLPFVYCGSLEYKYYIEGTSKPVHLIFKNLDFDDHTENSNLRDVYLWKPSKKGLKSDYSYLTKPNIIEERKQKYIKPDETERKGLITSRVGQGYYRQLILDKWNRTCPVTKCKIVEILISSHIVPWCESNDDERLDPENGILLSPVIDALFDKHLISFSDNGELLVSSKIDKSELIKLGVDTHATIPVTEGMKKYLKKHRASMNGNK